MADSRDLTHLDDQGAARMVDVGDKPASERTAVASGRLRMQPETLRVLMAGHAPKGDVLAVARVAGIQAAKKTPDLIPLCHAIQLTGCQVAFEAAGDDRLEVRAEVRASDRTGAEMEALTAVSVAALTVYDMLKAIDRAMVIESVQLERKTGGTRGDFQR